MLPPMVAPQSVEELRRARAAWQGPSHVWWPWVVAGLVGVGSWIQDPAPAPALRASLCTLVAAFGPYLAFREPPASIEGRAVAWLALAQVPLVAALALFAPRHAAPFLLLAVASAHEPIASRAARAFPFPRGGFVLGLVGAMATVLIPDPAARWLLVAPLVLLLQLSWLVLLLRARREERDPTIPVRFACPRCGAVQSRAPGKGPCLRCGLFVRLDPGAAPTPDPRPNPPRPEPLWLLCPTCRLRLIAPRGPSACPQCRSTLWSDWNVHVLGGAP